MLSLMVGFILAFRIGIVLYANKKAPRRSKEKYTMHVTCNELELIFMADVHDCLQETLKIIICNCFRLKSGQINPIKCVHIVSLKLCIWTYQKFDTSVAMKMSIKCSQAHRAQFVNVYNLKTIRCLNYGC